MIKGQVLQSPLVPQNKEKGILHTKTITKSLKFEALVKICSHLQGHQHIDQSYTYCLFKPK